MSQQAGVLSHRTQEQGCCTQMKGTTHVTCTKAAVSSCTCTMMRDSRSKVQMLLPELLKGLLISISVQLGLHACAALERTRPSTGWHKGTPMEVHTAWLDDVHGYFMMQSICMIAIC